tara:strand:- start:1078 stop:1368 length:291 start_codon:yes stop_codon:yes gene_type:complete
MSKWKDHEIDTSALDVPISELEDMTTEQRVDEQCYNIFGDNNWSYVNCGQSGYSKEEIKELVSEKKATLCRVTDIDDYEFDILVFDTPVEEVSGYE